MKSAIHSLTAFAALAFAAPSITIPPPALAASDKNATLSARGTDAPYGIKKGLAYNNGAVTDILSRPGSATWAYNWGAAQSAPKFQQIPMHWGVGPEGDKDGIWRKINAGDTPYVLRYNEPDFPRPDGCDATPKRAYAAWGNDMFRFSDAGAKLVCPGISSYNVERGFTGGPSGLTWLRRFASIGNNPDQFRCSAQAIHWYGEPNRPAAYQAELFKKYVSDTRREVNDIFRKDMPLWITEFAPEPRDDVNLMADFLRIVVPWLDQQDYVHRYAPFWAESMVDLWRNDLNNAGRAFVESRG